MKYIVIAEEGDASFGVYVPDLAGKDSGGPVPPPTSQGDLFEVRAALEARI